MAFFIYLAASSTSNPTGFGLPVASLLQMVRLFRQLQLLRLFKDFELQQQRRELDREADAMFEPEEDDPELFPISSADPGPGHEGRGNRHSVRQSVAVMGGARRRSTGDADEGEGEEMVNQEAADLAAAEQQTLMRYKWTHSRVGHKLSGKCHGSNVEELRPSISNTSYYTIAKLPYVHPYWVGFGGWVRGCAYLAV